VGYGWISRSPARATIGHWVLYGGLVLAIAAPWYVAVAIRQPGFAHYFLYEHHLRRFFSAEYHDNPVWFYVPVLLIGGMPWSMLLFPVARFLFSPSRQVASLRSPALGFFLLWAGWCIGFFSLSRGKLPPYVLPAVPALAVVIGCYLDRVLFSTSTLALFDRARTRVPQQAVGLIALAWLAIGTFGWWKHWIETPEYVLEAGVCVLAVVGVIAWGRRMSPRLGWGLCAVAVALAVYESAHQLVPTWSRRRSPLAQTESLAALLHDRNTAVAAYGNDWCSAPLELNQGDLPNFTYKSPEVLRKYLSEHAQGLLVTKKDWNRDTLRWAIPAGMAISRVVDAGETRVFVIEAAPCEDGLRSAGARGPIPGQGVVPLTASAGSPPAR
jgi:dolichol-phosphate mannosyltransferase